MGLRGTLIRVTGMIVHRDDPSAWGIKQPLVLCSKRDMTGVELIGLVLSHVVEKMSGKRLFTSPSNTS